MRLPRFVHATLRVLPRAAGGMLAVGALIGIPWVFYHPPAGVPVTLPLGPRPAATESPPPGLRPASHPAPSRTNGASLSPVLALRFSPGTVTVPSGSGAASAGSTGGSGGSGGGSGSGGSGSGGSGRGPQPSHAPSPAPSPSSPHPSPSPSPGHSTPGCVVDVRGVLAICATIRIGRAAG